MKLVKFEIKSGGKFNGDTTGPVVIDFSKSKMVGITGEEAEGKSTLLELFKMAAGQNGGKEVIEALKNKDNDTIDVSLEFVGNDKSDYEVKIKNGRITLRKDGVIQQSGQVGLLKEQLGLVGTSPLPLKNAPVEKLIKWLASYSNLGAEEFEKAMLKNKNGQKEAKKNRATANNSAKGNREYLKEEGVMNDDNEIIEKVWVAKEKEFATKPSIAALSIKLADAGKKSDSYLKVGEHLKSVESNEERQILEVKKLKKELADKEAELKATQEQILKDKEWLEKNKSYKTEYDSVKKEYDNAAQKAADYNKWQEIKQKKVEMDGYEDMAQKADALEKKLLKQQQELQWEVIPDIAGLEIVLEDSHEDEGEQKKEGFYINGMSAAQMSNTEFLTAIFKILKKNKVSVVVVDDASQFGTSLMETLSSLVKSGCFVIYTEMARGQQFLEIQYK